MTGEYAIRAMLHMAGVSFGTTVQISAIAKQCEIPDNFLRKIVTQLQKAGLITSQRGARGGIKLATPAESLTLLDIIEAVEGKIFLNKCLMHDKVCSRTQWCAVHIVWCEAQTKMKEHLSKRSLAEIAASDAGRYEEFTTTQAQATFDIPI